MSGMQTLPFRPLGAALAAIVMLASTGLVASAAAAAQPATQSGHRPFMIGVANQAVLEATRLNGVYCTAPANCWAVGSADTPSGAQVNQVEHWTGKKWSEVTVPNPAGTKNEAENDLLAVRCTTANDCWAVGDYQATVDTAEFSEALHWTGRKWSVATTPSPGGTVKNDFTLLVDVACTSKASCWAAGSYGSLGTFTTQLNEALRWNGKSWTQVKTPNPAGIRPGDGSALASVRCTSPSDCWAGGAEGSFRDLSTEKVSNELLHWNGKQWLTFPAPNPGGLAPGEVNLIFGLSCTSAKDCWAAGRRQVVDSPSDAKTVSELLRWNGAKWQPVKTPEPNGTGNGAFNELIGVNCSSTADCWAVGETGGNNGKPVLNQALHWNGVAWSAVSTPEPDGQGSGAVNGLVAVRCTSKANCWAVGSAGPGGGNNETLHWTGKKWFNDSSSIPPD